MVPSPDSSVTTPVMHFGLPPQEAPVVVAKTAKTFLFFSFCVPVIHITTAASSQSHCHAVVEKLAEYNGRVSPSSIVY